ncbi:hypothetical protein DYB37_009425 [Aphanomyces astaci]|uniref:ATP-dependent RNA helicase n=1 Tax=Aphanomyces astaci TaxID=112090 RepID=A0A397CNU6_APHAT|nr:hypothetical protein DYB25_005976 [Aphanomyces astaci]RHY44236.1 hypothetical protein DYB34_007656 [Aphanomyces astaci]RHY45472.1 hypothetical protein DYB30_007005 [Aphanomyces astaci]RHY46499.1 hypothetical protein DYB38_006578 [Aphanomyces astaci]RHY79342.1 hypothetical protein DYB26_004131 [Aphanomyces astaci]
MLRLFSRSLPLRQTSFLHKSMYSTKNTHVSDMPVTSLPISKSTLRALTEVMGYELLTKVQATTLPVILEGKDVLAKSKTGTGKTMAFLIPTIETLAHSHLHKKDKNNISALILSPSRELATQIEVEAKKLSTFHPIHIACVVGGVPMNKDLRRLSHPDGIDLLVATPGRLQDHLNNDHGDLVKRLAGIRILVLDEADRLLDMGFRRDIEKLLQYLPVARRQTLLFSATLPSSLEQIQRLALKTNHVFIDTVGEDEDQTNVHVKQSVVTCPFDDHIAALDKLLDAHIQSAPDGYKIIVFFPTARAAGFMAQLFLHAGYPVLEMHSRKSQPHRTKTAANFRAKDNQILFSSDVSARGVDYPGVTLVIQVGLTEKEQYIHRLGRTGRAGKAGEGVLLLSPFETPFLNELNDLPLAKMALANGKPPRVEESMRRVQSNAELRKAAEQAYQAWLGYYNSNLRRLKMTKDQLVDTAEEYSRIVGLDEVPALQKSTISKMGLQVAVDVEVPVAVDVEVPVAVAVVAAIVADVEVDIRRHDQDGSCPLSNEIVSKYISLLYLPFIA